MTMYKSIVPLIDTIMTSANGPIFRVTDHNNVVDYMST